MSSSTTAREASSARGESLLERALEGLTLRRAHATVLRTDAAVRVEVRSSLRRLRERRSAAEVCWTAGFRAEALGLAADAARIGATVLSLLGLPTSSALTVPDTLPAQDDDFVRAHEALYFALMAASARAHHVALPAAMTLRELLVARLLRWASLVSLVGAFAGFLYLIPDRPASPGSVRASGHWGNQASSKPQNAVDTDARTEWALPDASPGWIEIALVAPQRVGHVELLNGINAPHNDRAARDFTVELHYQGRSVAAREGSFAVMRPDPGWTRVDVSAPLVDRVRVEVRSWHGKSGALAEVRVLP